MSLEMPTIVLAIGMLLVLAVTLGVLSARLFLSATRTSPNDRKR
jgi:hypothetical protein